MLGVYRGGWINILNPLRTYAVSTDGLGEVPAKLPAALGEEPHWSRDGKWTVFTVADPNPNSPTLYIMRSDGRGRTRVRLQPNATFGPAWSPDGKQIAYFDPGGREPGISIINVECLLQEKRCQPEPVFFTRGDFPDWSPDGEQIAYAGYYDVTANNILIARVDKRTEPVSIAPNLQKCRHPKWSPDGMSVVFSCSGTLYTARADGSDLTKLKVGGADPSWSPDGKHIVYVSDEDRGLDQCLNGECTLSSNALFSMSADGHQVTRLTKRDDESILWYSWLPAQPAQEKR